MSSHVGGPCHQPWFLREDLKDFWGSKRPLWRCLHPGMCELSTVTREAFSLIPISQIKTLRLPLSLVWNQSPWRHQLLRHQEATGSCCQ